MVQINGGGETVYNSGMDKVILKGGIEWMRGTAGEEDYIVVAKSGDVALGLKCVIDALDTAGFFIGLRVRSAPVSGKECGALDLVGPWPRLSFAKVGDDRASLMVGLVAPVTGVESLRDVISEEEFAGSIIEYLNTHIDTSQFVIDESGFREAILGMALASAGELAEGEAVEGKLVVSSMDVGSWFSNGGGPGPDDTIH